MAQGRSQLLVSRPIPRGRALALAALLAVLSLTALTAARPQLAAATAPCTPAADLLTLAEPDPLAIPPFPGEASCFEGFDGDQVAGHAGHFDWQELVPPTTPAGVTFLSAPDDGAHPADTMFDGGDKENDPGGWDFATGSLGGDKFDALAVASAADSVSGNVLLYGAFERAGGVGDTNVSFELNRDAGTYDNDGNAATPEIPIRSDGDLLVTFDGGAGSVAVGMCMWHGDRFGESSTDPAKATFGWYTLPGFGLGGVKLEGGVKDCTNLSGLATPAARGAMNVGEVDSHVPNMGGHGTDPVGKIGDNKFGEMVVNVSDALATRTNPNPCFSFGSIWIHTRSSSEATSTMKDRIFGPAAQRAIEGAKSCAIAVDKKVAVQPGASGPTPGAADYHQGTVADPAYAVTGDKLFYAFEVTNPGQVPVLEADIGITDSRCDSDNDGTADNPTIGLGDKNGGADGSPATLDPGDTWVYRCTRVLGAGDALPFSNTVNVTGEVGTPGCPSAGNPACLSATDTAVTSAKPVIDVQASSHTVTFGDAAPTITCTYDAADFIGGDDEADLTTSPNTGATVYTSTSGVSGSPYGSSCSGATDEKYAFNYIPGTVTVVKRTVDVQASSHAVTFGDAKPTVTCAFDAADFVGGDTAADVDTPPTSSTAYDPGDGVGGSPYGTSCSGASDANYDFSYLPGAVTVSKKVLDVQASSHTVTFGDGKPAVTCAFDSADFVGGDTAAAIDTPPTGSTAYDPGDGVGGSPYGTSCAGGSDVNYDFSYLPGAVTVVKRTVDVQASSHAVTFGDAKPAVTCAFDSADFAGGDTAGDVDTPPTSSTAYDPGDGVGGSPYGTSCAGASDANYDFNYLPGAVTVSKKVVDVTASSHTVTFGDPPPTVTCAFDAGDFAGGDSAADIDTPPTSSTAYDQGDGVAAGPYGTSCSGASDANYDFSYTAGQVVVNKAPLTVTAPSPGVTYGDPVPPLPPGYGGFQPGDGPGDLGTAPTCSTTYDQGDGAGGNPYPTNCAGGVDDDYDFVYVPGAVTVARRALEVTADPKTKVYGSADPPLTHQITKGSLVAGDALSGGLQRDAGEDVGQYDIKQGTVTAGPNYDLTYVGAKLTITPKPVNGTFAAADKVYDGTTSASASDRQLTGVVAGDDVSLNGGTTAFPNKNVGAYNLSLTGAALSGADKGNYSLTGVADDPAQITPKPVIGSFTAADKDYDGNTDATITGRSLTGAIGSEIVTLVGGTGAFDDPEPGVGKPVKGSGFSIAGADKANYVLIRVEDARATIRQRPAPPAEPPPVIDSTNNCLRRPVIAFVRGKGIKRVIFILDGKRIARVTKRDAQKRFSTRIERRTLGDGKHKLQARVFFFGGRKPLLLDLKLTRCVDKKLPVEIKTTRLVGRTCPPKPFLAFVKGGTISRVRFTLDGKTLKTVRVADWKARYGVTLTPASLGAGPSVLEARITFIRGSKTVTAVLKRTFPPCGAKAAGAPQ